MELAKRYLETMAAKCRDAYITERTLYELKRNKKLRNRKPPYRYTPSPKHDGLEDENGNVQAAEWPKTAKFMVEHGLDPYFCTRKRFEIAKGGDPPWPNQVPQEKYLDLYKGSVENLSDQDVQISFDLEKQYCRVALTSTRYNREGIAQKDVWISLLLDDLLDLSPLMRYCLAKQLSLAAVADVYAMRAMGQYAMAPRAYNLVWGASIPEELKDEAIAAYHLACVKDVAGGKSKKKGKNSGR